MRAHGLHPAYANVGVIPAWRTAGYLGPDHFALPNAPRRLCPDPRMIPPVASPPRCRHPRAAPQPVPQGPGRPARGPAVN